MTEVKVREAFPVKISNLTMYCESMKFSAETAIYEHSTVTGYPIMTNKCRKMTRISFTGRVYNDKTPMRLAGLANNLNSYEGVEIIYRDIRFYGCIITGFSAEDSGEDYIKLTINAATTYPVFFLDEVSK
ncbi:MAG: hypothetical protein J6B75_04850 [Ruminococcus sp.]|nr:hypothetical protein [Ruminococcus sp.]